MRVAGLQPFVPRLYQGWSANKYLRITFVNGYGVSLIILSESMFLVTVTDSSHCMVTRIGGPGQCNFYRDDSDIYCQVTGSQMFIGIGIYGTQRGTSETNPSGTLLGIF